MRNNRGPQLRLPRTRVHEVPKSDYDNVWRDAPPFGNATMAQVGSFMRDFWWGGHKQSENVGWKVVDCNVHVGLNNMVRIVIVEVREF